MEKSQIEKPFDDIAGLFNRGMIVWIKKNYPLFWAEVLETEREMSKASLSLDESRVDILVKKYERLVRDLSERYEARKDNRKRANGQTNFPKRAF